MSARQPISVLLLARDETRDLEELLPALGFAAEIVVVWDEAGDPATRATAERAGAVVVTRRLEGFGVQRACGLARCTQPWVLWIDADERPGLGVAAFLERTIGHGPPRAVARAHRITWFLGRRIRHCGWANEWLPRFFPREGSRFDDAPVHERIEVEGGTILPDSPDFEIQHLSYRSFRACRDKLMLYAHAGAERAAREGRSATVLDVAIRPPLRFLRQYVLQAGFLDGAHGLVLCSLAAWQVGLKYAELWARRHSAPER